MTHLPQQLRFAFRTLRKNSAFTSVVVITLALGIGANTAIFGLIDQLLIRSLPVLEPERLVVIDAPGPFSGSSHQNSDVFTVISQPMFEALRDRNTVFESVLAHYNTSVHVSAGGETEDVRGELVSGTFFPGLGVRPAIGRLFTAEDDLIPGGHPVVVLGHGYWRRRFAESPDVVGSAISINGHPMTVVGVSEAGFHGVEVGVSVDLYVPIMMQAQVIPTWTRGIGDWRARWLTPMARLAEGVSLEEAQAGINVLYSQLLQEDFATIQTRSESFRERFLKKELVLVPGGRGTSELRFQSRTPLLVLSGMVAFVLLIACANVANLLLARSLSRRREMALRVAIGASRSRLVRQLLLESSLLALSGGVLGILVASWTGDALIRALPFDGISEAFTSSPDLRVVLFTFVLSLGTGLAFGILPSLSATAQAIAPTLEADSVRSPGRSSSRFRRALVVVQIALSLLLLIGAGLFVRSLLNLHAIDPGFEPDRLIAFSVDPSLNGYDLGRRRSVLRQIRDEVASEPGVRSVSLAEVALMTNSNSSSTVNVEGYQRAEGEDVNPNTNGVAPGFFTTLGIPLVSGRDFTDADDASSTKVAVVNETFVSYFFKDEDPLGRRIGFGRDALDITIVGVVRDGKSTNIREEPRRFVYLPYVQSTDLGSVTLYIRAQAAAEALGRRLREAVARVDPTLPVTDLKTMREQIRESLFVERLVAALSITFGVLATLLAALGLYGLISYAVSSRTREIGIRMALGARRRGVLLLVFKEVVVLLVLGVIVGLPSGYALGRLVETQLYGLGGADPTAMAVAAAVLVLTSLLASCLPAMRASRVQPVVALRYE
ncbi:MAG TPA: ABC transporter permease [Vicinamibacteria bacterium]|nr:ABC transporter permease [Vicinamibacteria bacterium]